MRSLPFLAVFSSVLPFSSFAVLLCWERPDPGTAKVGYAFRSFRCKAQHSTASRTILKPKRDRPIRWPAMARNGKVPSTKVRIASQCRISKNFVTGAVVSLDKHVSNENLFCLFWFKNPYEPNCLRIPTSTSQENFTLHKSNRLRMNDRIYKICPCHSVNAQSPKCIETLPDNFSTLGIRTENHCYGGERTWIKSR